MRKYLTKKDKHDPRDHHYGMYKAIAHASELPTSVDLRDKAATIPFFDQGQLGSCTANAICFLKEYNDHIGNTQEEGEFFYLSRLFLYWHERSYEGTTTQDSGAFIRDGFKTLSKIGVCGESFFPYDISTFTNTPSTDAEENAKLHTISQYYRLIGPTMIKQSLANDGLPVVIGIDVYESFESAEVARTGIVPMPDTSKEQLLGGHAVCVVGYREDGYFIVRNSWGEGWGDKGYFYLPEEFFDHYVSDCWTGV